MKVRTLLLASLSTALLLMAVLCFAAWRVGHHLDHQADIQNSADEIGSQVSTLLVLTNEYALHEEARVIDQWRSTHKKIVTLLETDAQTDTSAPTHALEQTRVLSLFFDQLVAPDRHGGGALEVRRTRLLVDQMLTQTQALFDTVDRWGRTASMSRLQLDNQFRFLFYATTIVMMLILSMLVALLWHRVLQPLSALHTTVRALTDGNLNARSSLQSTDEFGDLSRSFDAMANARQKSEADLRESKNFMTLLIDVVPGMVGYWTADLVSTFANSHYKDWFGKSKEQMAGIRMQDLLGDALFQMNKPFILAALQGENQQFERRIVKPDGTVGYIWAHYMPDREGERIKGFFVLVSDITPIKLAEQAAVASEQFATGTFNSVNDQLCVLNSSGVILKVNRPWCEFLDKNCAGKPTPDYGVGSNYLTVCDSATGPYSADGQMMAEGIRKVMRGDCPVFSLEYAAHSPEEDQWFVATVTRFEGASANIVVAHKNISVRKKAELELEKLAQIDALTGLPNRRHFLALAEQELTRTRRYGGGLSVLMMDLDHFKIINDTHGHRVGDSVLVRIGGICKEVLRTIDSVGRIGGEEFAILLPQTTQQVAKDVANRLRTAVSLARIPIEGDLFLTVTASFGLAEFAIDDAQIESLLHKADMALYEAKRTGRNKVCMALEP